ncbi:hypothetical protein [Pedobacter gandavensis]|uniref:hypothetical protein n=1 Tax=Pedobacter gandavensis TaxID=2679963 RepID=UPI00292F964F|nr:hypothetical protein [Pedobacter gandavensis]
MKDKFYLLFLLVCFQLSVLAQKHKTVEPLYQFMQANADSTLVLEFTSSWFHFPEHYLLSKKGDTISCYTYKAPENIYSYGPTPAKISSAMYKFTMKILSVPLDVNQYFSSYTKNLEERKSFWNQLSILQPWALKDDSVEGEGCPAIPHTERIPPVVYDAGGVKITLITKKEIKTIDFYGPQFYEENCPGRPARIAINKMAKLFDDHFKIKSVYK